MKRDLIALLYTLARIAREPVEDWTDAIDDGYRFADVYLAHVKQRKNEH